MSFLKKMSRIYIKRKEFVRVCVCVCVCMCVCVCVHLCNMYICIYLEKHRGIELKGS